MNIVSKSYWDLQNHDNWIRKMIEDSEVEGSDEESDQMQISTEEPTLTLDSRINSTSTIISAPDQAHLENLKIRNEKLKCAEWVKIIVSEENIKPEKRSFEFINVVKKGKTKTPEHVIKERKRFQSAKSRKNKKAEIAHLLAENNDLKNQITRNGALDPKIEEQYNKLEIEKNTQETKATGIETTTLGSSEEAKRERKRQYAVKNRERAKERLNVLKAINELSKKQLQTLSGESTIEEEDKTNKRKRSEEEPDKNVESTETPIEFSSPQKQMINPVKKGRRLSIKTPEEKEASRLLKNKRNRERGAEDREIKKNKIEDLHKENALLEIQINEIGTLDSEIKKYYNQLQEMAETVKQSRGKRKGPLKKAPKSPEEIEAKKKRQRESAVRSREREKTLLMTLEIINELSKEQLQNLLEQKRNSEARMQNLKQSSQVIFI